MKPRAIVSSPLSRARDTALAAGRLLGLDVETDADLIEISHGEWEGLLKSEIATRWPQMFAQWQTAPQSVRFPAGESLADVKARWRRFLAGVEHRGSPLLVVTHDVVVRLAVMDARGEPLSAFNSIASENAAISEIEGSSGALNLVRLNDASHLGDLRADPATQAL